MTILQAYLQSPKARRTLSKRPGDQGFSLIELVVVVAILAILAAVALPNFLGVSKDGQIAAAKNTLATIIKECSVKDTRTGNSQFGQTGQAGANAPIQAATGNLNGYTLTWNANLGTAAVGDKINLAAGQASVTKPCYSASAVPTAGAGVGLPTFAVAFDSTNGSTLKSCKTPGAGGYNEGCFTLGTSNTETNADTIGEW